MNELFIAILYDTETPVPFESVDKSPADNLLIVCLGT